MNVFCSYPTLCVKGTVLNGGMRYYLRIFISKNDLLPVDPQPKNYFPKRRWERWSDEALREDGTSGKGNILMEREAMYSKAGKRVIVGDSGLTAYVIGKPFVGRGHGP